MLFTRISHSKILEFKTRGGLIKPCKDIINICKIIEKYFRILHVSKKDIYITLFYKILNKIPKFLLKMRHENDAERNKNQIIKKIVGIYELGYVISSGCWMPNVLNT